MDGDESGPGAGGSALTQRAVQAWCGLWVTAPSWAVREGNGWSKNACGDHLNWYLYYNFSQVFWKAGVQPRVCERAVACSSFTRWASFPFCLPPSWAFVHLLVEFYSRTFPFICHHGRNEGAPELGLCSASFTSWELCVVTQKAQRPQSHSSEQHCRTDVTPKPMSYGCAWGVQGALWSCWDQSGSAVTFHSLMCRAYKWKSDLWDYYGNVDEWSHGNGTEFLSVS